VVNEEDKSVNVVGLFLVPVQKLCCDLKGPFHTDVNWGAFLLAKLHGKRTVNFQVFRVSILLNFIFGDVNCNTKNTVESTSRYL